MTIRVAALTRGLNTPSARFRVRQYIEPLRASGIDVTEVLPRVRSDMECPPRFLPYASVRRSIRGVLYGLKAAARVPNVVESHRHRITWLQRELVPGVLTFEFLVQRPFVFDVDDAIWLSLPAGGPTCRAIASAAEVVLAGNQYIADWFSPHAKNIRILPTAVDTDRFKPAIRPEDDRFVIGWIGTPSNYKYIVPLEKVFARILEACPKAELLFVSEHPPLLPSLPKDRVRFEAWSPATEVASIQSMDMGLMPLADDPWARGKCSFKMLQYMSCGLPVVVSPVGLNREILSLASVGHAATEENEWIDATVALYRDRHEARRLGDGGRRLVEARFARNVVSKQLVEVFTTLA